MKDYYNILGVSRDADEEAIKKAYRSLAKEWHPDKHQSVGEEQRKAAEDKFKEISEAYAVLSDPQKKSNYDLSGDPNQSNRFGFRTSGDPMDFFGADLNFGFRRQPPGPRPLFGQTVQLGLSLTLAEALFGSERFFQYQVHNPCDVCNMRGGVEFTTCEDCKGTGTHTQRNQNGNQFISFQTFCNSCGGVGERMTKPCEKCAGNRSLSEERKITVKVPPGLHTGAVLRVAGAGGKGFLGGADGDLLLQTSVHYPDLSKFSDEERASLSGLLNR